MIRPVVQKNQFCSWKKVSVFDLGAGARWCSMARLGSTKLGMEEAACWAGVWQRASIESFFFDIHSS